MGYIKHETVIVTTGIGDDLPDIEAFRSSIPEPFRPLIVGPVQSVTNSYWTTVMLPDGSKEGWDTSDDGDEIRERFIALFGQRYADGSSVHAVVHVQFGEDYRVECGITAVDPREG